MAQADLTFQPNLANLALPELRRACDVAGDQRLRGCRNKETIHHVRKSVTPHEKLFPSEGSAVRQNFAGDITGERCGARSTWSNHQIVIDSKAARRTTRQQQSRCDQSNLLPVRVSHSVWATFTPILGWAVRTLHFFIAARRLRSCASASTQFAPARTASCSLRRSGNVQRRSGTGMRKSR